MRAIQSRLHDKSFCWIRRPLLPCGDARGLTEDDLHPRELHTHPACRISCIPGPSDRGDSPESVAAALGLRSGPMLLPGRCRTGYLDRNEERLYAGVSRIPGVAFGSCASIRTSSGFQPGCLSRCRLRRRRRPTRLGDSLAVRWSFHSKPQERCYQIPPRLPIQSTHSD